MLDRSPDFTARKSSFDLETKTWVPAPGSQATYRQEPTDCAEKARIRLETSGVLLGLTALGLVVGRRILRPEVLPVG